MLGAGLETRRTNRALVDESSLGGENHGQGHWFCTACAPAPIPFRYVHAESYECGPDADEVAP
ncbi:hypothetical protein M184_gp11 [Mycobacterium phage WIVsmall]|uniref:hypothetical protein n=1 Tax=Mycobacterium phage WIVsmall TaxID=1327036 RepID=UPI00032B4811|nr:hypothetical protein M184_gp11 [Mycobacterium phage WIVsmall]AGK88159.1 hypothetical protein WIVsmall_11 [Mycobacterium phage WIVsmall]